MSGDAIHLFREDGIQLDREQEKEELVRYWTRISTAMTLIGVEPGGPEGIGIMRRSRKSQNKHSQNNL